MTRRILLVTTDQQRYDALGCNGGGIARTPAVDGLAAAGIRFERAHPQSVVCMPSRSTILTGQYPRTHGVWMNGVPLDPDAPSVAAVLHAAGYRTALVGKAHFEPFLDPFGRFRENITDPDPRPELRGFEHFETATHTPLGPLHYARWMQAEHPDELGGFYRVLDARLEVNGEGGGDTGAPQVAHNPVPREHYHTDWVADRTIAWLDTLDDDDAWFVWMSFPDPHHPWDPPAAELGRVPWRDLDLPPGYPVDRAEREAAIDARPRHWRLWYEGEWVANYEAPPGWVPATLTPDQVREIDAATHVENELIDEACGRVLSHIERRGWADTTDVIFTTDHGEFQGDHGFLFKGPYHVDSLLRVPLIWRPAPAAGLAPAVVTRPVGHLDIAPTLCAIAGVEPPPFMQGRPLPVDDADAGERGFERVVTEWDSEHWAGDVHARTIHRDGLTCTVYEPGTVHDGTEGELYDHAVDPLQRVNLWDDPARRSLRDDLVADLRASLPPAGARRRRPAAPV